LAQKQTLKTSPFHPFGTESSMHDVKALVAEEGWLRNNMATFEKAVICPLCQGFALIPITDSFAAELKLSMREAHAPVVPEMAPGLGILALRISDSAAVAYISTEYFGGHGGQDAVAWSKGDVIFSPESEGYDGSWPNSPISQALRAIGVVAHNGQDEFDTLGLGRHRETHRWAAAFASS
jgi:hypothetical protein